MFKFTDVTASHVLLIRQLDLFLYASEGIVALWVSLAPIYHRLARRKSIEKAKIQPLATPKPLDRSSQKWHAGLRSGRYPTSKILYRSVLGFLLPKYVILPCLLV